MFRNSAMRKFLAWTILAAAIAVIAWFVHMQRDLTSQALPQQNMMELSYPKPGIILPMSSPKQAATVILLHGLGDSSAGWEPVGMQLRSSLPHVKWVFPTAPMVCSTRVRDCIDRHALRCSHHRFRRVVFIP